MRQDDELWDQLHAGVLTSSTLVGAMALCERAAAKLIPGWPRYLLSHSSAHFAASRLAEPLHASFDSSATDVHAALHSNYRTMGHLNSLKLKQQVAAGGASSRTPSQQSCSAPCAHVDNIPCPAYARNEMQCAELAKKANTTEHAALASAPHPPGRAAAQSAM